MAGIGRIIVVGSKQSDAEVRSYGVTDVTDRHGADIRAQIRSLVGDDLLYAYDSINPPDGQILAIDALSNSKKGSLARSIPLPIDESKVKGKATGFDAKGIFGSSQAKSDVAAPFWERVTGYLESGQPKPLSF